MIIPKNIEIFIGGEIEVPSEYKFLMEFVSNISGKYEKSIILFNFMAGSNQIDMFFSNYESDSHIEIKFFRKKHLCNSKTGPWFRISDSGAKETTTNGYHETRNHSQSISNSIKHFSSGENFKHKKKGQYYYYFKNILHFYKGLPKGSEILPSDNIVEVADGEIIYEMLDHKKTLSWDEKTWRKFAVDHLNMKKVWNDNELLSLSFKSLNELYSKLKLETKKFGDWIETPIIDNNNNIISITDLKESINSKNIVIYGDSGCGKSILCYNLLKLLSAEYIRIPIKCKSYRGRLTDDIDNLIGAWCAKDFQDIIQLRDKGKLTILLYLDGVNEVESGLLDTFKLECSKISKRSNVRLLYSSQSEDGESIIDAEAFWINKLENKHLAQISGIDESNEMLRVINTGFEANLLSKLHSKKDKFKIYEIFVEYFHSKIDHQNTHKHMNFFSKIAFHMFSEIRRGIEISVLVDKLNIQIEFIDSLKNGNIAEIINNRLYFKHDLIRDFFLIHYHIFKATPLEEDIFGNLFLNKNFCLKLYLSHLAYTQNNAEIKKFFDLHLNDELIDNIDNNIYGEGLYDILKTYKDSLVKSSINEIKSFDFTKKKDVAYTTINLGELALISHIVYKEIIDQNLIATKKVHKVLQDRINFFQERKKPLINLLQSIMDEYCFISNWLIPIKLRKKTEYGYKFESSSVSSKIKTFIFKGLQNYSSRIELQFFINCNLCVPQSKDSSEFVCNNIKNLWQDALAPSSLTDLLLRLDIKDIKLELLNSVRNFLIDDCMGNNIILNSLISDVLTSFENYTGLTDPEIHNIVKGQIDKIISNTDHTDVDAHQIFCFLFDHPYENYYAQHIESLGKKEKTIFYTKVASNASDSQGLFVLVNILKELIDINENVELFSSLIKPSLSETDFFFGSYAETLVFISYEFAKLKINFPRFGPQKNNYANTLLSLGETFYFYCFDENKEEEIEKIFESISKPSKDNFLAFVEFANAGHVKFESAEWLKDQHRKFLDQYSRIFSNLFLSVIFDYRNYEISNKEVLKFGEMQQIININISDSDAEKLRQLEGDHLFKKIISDLIIEYEKKN